ncbi:hypothetical protein AgCh_018614 [Apium graveolens]
MEVEYNLISSRPDITIGHWFMKYMRKEEYPDVDDIDYIKIISEEGEEQNNYIIVQISDDKYGHDSETEYNHINNLGIIDNSDGDDNIEDGLGEMGENIIREVAFTLMKSHVGFHRQSFTGEAPTTDEGDTLEKWGLYEQLNLTIYSSYYLWYLTDVNISSNEWFLKHGKDHILTIMTAGHTLQVFVNGQPSGK